MKKFEIAMVLGFILSIALTSTFCFASDCSAVRGEVLRLHILANSDEEADQELKLLVRDRVLEETGELFSGAQSLETAQTLARENLMKIVSVAEEEIAKNGYSYPVTASLVRMYFETRQYDGFTLPAGTYDAVRIEIGKAEGKNWWCVMFPPICVTSAMNPDELENILSKKSEEVLKGSQKYKVKFYIVELFERWFAK
jgi:stage II sporulation protein R